MKIIFGLFVFLDNLRKIILQHTPNMLRDLLSHMHNFNNTVSQLIVVKPVFVVTGEAVDDDRHWESHDEDAAESTEASDELAQERVRVQVVADSRYGHQTPPRNKLGSIEVRGSNPVKTKCLGHG